MSKQKLHTKPISFEPMSDGMKRNYLNTFERHLEEIIDDAKKLENQICRKRIANIVEACGFFVKEMRANSFERGGVKFEIVRSNIPALKWFVALQLYGF
jgi:hypothetical protein